MKLSVLLHKGLKKVRLSDKSGSSIARSSKVESGSSVTHSSLGEHSFCGYDCEVYHAKIGAYSSIANGVIIGGGRHPVDWAGMSPVFYAGRDSVSLKLAQHKRPPVPVTHVGNDVWIGRSAIVISGVSIGDGAVIGAGSVVTKDVPPYAIYAGNPARLVRFRFDDGLIQRFLASEWWGRPESELRMAAKHAKDPERFLDALQATSLT